MIISARLVSKISIFLIGILPILQSSNPTAAEDTFEIARGVECTFSINGGRKIRVFALEMSEDRTILGRYEEALGVLDLRLEKSDQQFTIFLKRDFPESKITVIDSSALRERNRVTEEQSRYMLRLANEKVVVSDTKVVDGLRVVERCEPGGDRVCYYIDKTNGTTLRVESTSDEVFKQFSLSEINVRSGNFQLCLPTVPDIIVQSEDEMKNAVKNAIRLSMPSTTMPDLAGIFKDFRPGSARSNVKNNLNDAVKAQLARVNTFVGLEQFVRGVEEQQK